MGKEAAGDEWEREIQRVAKVVFSISEAEEILVVVPAPKSDAHRLWRIVHVSRNGLVVVVTDRRTKGQALSLASHLARDNENYAREYFLITGGGRIRRFEAPPFKTRGNQLGHAPSRRLRRKRRP